MSVFIKSTSNLYYYDIIYMLLKGYRFEADFLEITNKMLKLSIETLVY